MIGEYALIGAFALEFSAAGAAGVDVDAGELAGGVVGGEVVGLIKLGMIKIHSLANY